MQTPLIHGWNGGRRERGFEIEHDEHPLDDVQPTLRRELDP